MIYKKYAFGQSDDQNIFLRYLEFIHNSWKCFRAHKGKMGVLLLHKVKVTFGPTQGWRLIARKTNYVIR